MPVQSGEEFSQIKSYPPAKEVTDFHRNSDADRTAEAIHHSLGRSRVQASPGDHNHDGGTSLPLFAGNSSDGTNFDDDVSKESGLRSAIKKIVQALATKGASDTLKDNTKAWLVSRVQYFTNTTDRNTAYAQEPFGICGVGGTVDSATLYWRDNSTWRPIQNTSTPATAYAQVISWKASTALYASYPDGWSVFDLAAGDTDGGYPETGNGSIVETLRLPTNNKIYQWWYRHSTNPAIYVRRGTSTAWSDWVLVAGSPPSVTSGLSIPTGSTFSLNNYWFRNNGNTVDISISLAYSGVDITVGASGNITDIPGICIVPAGWRPLTSQNIDLDVAGVSRWFGIIRTNGNVDLTHGIPGVKLTSGQNIMAHAMYSI